MDDDGRVRGEGGGERGGGEHRGSLEAARAPSARHGAGFGARRTRHAASSTGTSGMRIRSLNAMTTKPAPPAYCSGTSHCSVSLIDSPGICSKL